MSGRDLQVVVVVYRQARQLDACLAALNGEFPVTVVDNSSSAEIESVVTRHGAAYVDAGSNRGFAAGVNIALRRFAAGLSDVLLVNPDAVVRPSVVHTLVAHLRQVRNERVGAIAPRLSSSDGADQRVLWPFSTPLRACAEAVGLGWLPARRSFVIGAVLLLRGEALRDVGCFDERFFLYAEEADWQRRAVDRGWTSVLCSDAVAEHLGGGASTDVLLREALFHAAQETYIRKWHGPAGWWLYRVASCGGAAARSLLLARERRAGARRRALLYLRGPRRCAAFGVE